VLLEVKWTEVPTSQDIKHLQVFLDEYPEAKKGFLVCRTPHPMKLSNKIFALPWNQVSTILSSSCRDVL